MADGVLITRRSASELSGLIRKFGRRPRTLTGPRLPPQTVVPFIFQRFELKDALSAQGTATVYLLEWDSANEELVRKTALLADGSSEDIKFTVRDMLGWTGSAGAKGYAIKMHDIADESEVLSMECP